MRSQGIFKTSGPLHPHWVLILKWSMCYNILMLQCSQDLQVETFRWDPFSLPQSTGWVELRGEMFPLGQSTPRAVSIVTMGSCCRLNQECLPWLSNPGLVLLGVGRHLKRLPWWRAEITGHALEEDLGTLVCRSQSQNQRVWFNRFGIKPRNVSFILTQWFWNSDESREWRTLMNEVFSLKNRRWTPASCWMLRYGRKAYSLWPQGSQRLVVEQIQRHMETCDNKSPKLHQIF